MARSVLIGARLWGKGTPSLGNEQLVLLSLKWTFLAKRISVEGATRSIKIWRCFSFPSRVRLRVCAHTYVHHARVTYAPDNI